MATSKGIAKRVETSAIALPKAQALLLAEALQRGEATRNVMEDALVDYGRWILVHVFADDAAAALDAKSDNPLWLSLVGRAGGPTLRISKRILYVAVEIAARDKRINDDIWRSLEPGRKELLLPLGNEKVMRKAAKHVVEMKLSQGKTRAYVTTLRAEQGSAPKRRPTVARIVGRVRSFQKIVGTGEALQDLKRVVKAASPKEKKDLKRELDSVAKWLVTARRTLLSG